MEAFWSSAGTRIQFWTKSAEFVADAPVIGHGTGMTELLFRRGAAGEPETPGLITHNPHNQILAVAVQLGLVGTIVLIAMWVAHLALFREATWVSWLGLMIVVQNIISSLFNSHLTDFTQGWIYVLGVGAMGAMVLPRAPVKREGINLASGSRLVEEKAYKSFEREGSDQSP
jgi:hypothetical protein